MEGKLAHRVEDAEQQCLRALVRRARYVALDREQFTRRQVEGHLVNRVRWLETRQRIGQLAHQGERVPWLRGFCATAEPGELRGETVVNGPAIGTVHHKRPCAFH